MSYSSTPPVRRLVINRASHLVDRQADSADEIFGGHYTETETTLVDINILHNAYRKPDLWPSTVYLENQPEQRLP